MASVQKRQGTRGTTYRVMWRLPSGEQRSKTVKTKDEARALRIEVEALEQRGRAPDPQRGAIALSEWSESFLGTLHLKPKTRLNYESLLRSRILPVFGERTLTSLTRLDVQTWVADMAGEVGPSRVKAAYALLNQMLIEAVRHDRLLVNPAEGVRLPKVMRNDVSVLSLDQLQAVAAECGRYEPLILFLGVMGTRWAEAIGLTWDKVGECVTIDTTLSEVQGKLIEVPPKTYAIRRLPLPGELVLPPREHDHVFTTTYGNPIRSAKFRKDVWWPALDKAGVERIKLHDLRHTCASILINQGASVVLVSRWLGHADVNQTLNTYSHLFPNDLTEIANKMDKLLDKGPSVG